MTKLQARCWMAVIDAVYWLIQDALAKRIGKECRSPGCGGIFASLSSARRELDAVVRRKQD